MVTSLVVIYDDVIVDDIIGTILLMMSLVIICDRICINHSYAEN